MTPEKAFLARVFVDYCINSNDQARLENSLPVVTMLVFRIQAAWHQLIAAMQTEEEEMLLRAGMDDDEENERRAEREEERLDLEFIIAETLRMAVNLDYADEIGRRKMFQLVRTSYSVTLNTRVLTEHGCRQYDLPRYPARKPAREMFGCTEKAISQRT